MTTQNLITNNVPRGLLALGVLSLWSGGLSAQHGRVLVAPSAYSKVEAPGLVFWALSPFTARRQLVIEESQIRGGKGLVLRSIAMRRNGGDRSAYDSGRVIVDIWVSHTTRTAQTLSPIFAHNRGKDFVHVRSGVLTLHRTGRLMRAPASWMMPHSVDLRFSTGFTYKGGSLLIETLTRPAPRLTPAPAADAWWPIDGVTSSRTGRVMLHGKSCMRRMDLLPASADPGSLVLGGNAHFHLRGIMDSPVALFILGFNNKRMGPFKIPIHLGMLGAKGCFLYNDAAYLHLSPVWTGLKARSQLATIAVPLPNHRILVGRSLFGQWVLPDARANRLGLSFSNGVQAILASQAPSLGMGWVEAPSSTARRGEILPGRAPVLRFLFTRR